MRLKPYLSAHSGGSRSGAWKTWLVLVAKEGSEMLLEAADAFDDYAWNKSYGGPNWAIAARVAYEYHKNVISKRVFIDRCWTLQHNGGCIFNKFYGGMGGLKAVLETQATEPYTALVPSASKYVKELWNGVQRAQAKEDSQQRIIERLTSTVRSLT